MKSMMTTLDSLQATLKLLSDPLRLRLCALLTQAELVVQELVTITGLQQSRVSNHLSLLKRAGLVRDRREGTWSFHSLIEPVDGGPLSPSLFQATVQSYIDADEGLRDQSALQAVLDRRRQKSRDAHDRLAEQWHSVGQDFAVGTLRAEILAQAWPCGPKVVDLGCGTGFLAAWLAERSDQVIGVDHSERMLAEASANVPGAQFRQGELDALPLEAEEVHAAFANLVWHHLPDHDAAAREVHRILRPGGYVVVSDLMPHESEWMRERMGDLRLGLKPDQVVASLARVGFQDLVSEPLADRYCVTGPDGSRAEFLMFVVRGRKPDGPVSPATE
ncbi:MAG: SAM-dependent methyltransferase [Planctomycetota bacterium]|jgi:SAM-dependent methyltransferase